MKAGALLAVLLCLVVLTQATEVLINTQLDGCDSSGFGRPMASWTGSVGSISHTYYSFLFTSTPPGDVCFANLYAPTSQGTLTQIITVPSTGSYDFSGLVACHGSTSYSCDYTLTINGQNFPLTGGSFAATDPTTYVPVTASGITLTAGTYPLVFTQTSASGAQGFTSSLSLVTSGGGSGDPHFVGFQGQRFDYIGEADQVINLVSDPSLQVNTLLGLQKAGDATFIPGPVMMEMAFMTRGHTVSINAGGYQKDQVGFVSVDGALLPLGDSFLDDILSVTFTALNANSKDLGLTGNDHIVSQVDVKLEGLYEFRVFMIENGRDPEHPERWMVKYPHRFLDFNASLLDEDRRPHGVLGQTAAPLSKDRSVVEWTIEGKDEDYVVKDGLTGTQFTFNQFQ